MILAVLLWGLLRHTVKDLMRANAYAEILQVMQKEMVQNTILTMGQLCRRMLRPQTVAMLLDLFWSLVYWFANTEKGVVKVSEMYEAALPNIDWDFLNTKGHECKERAQESKEMVKAEQIAKKSERKDAKMKSAGKTNGRVAKKKTDAVTGTSNSAGK